MADTFFAEDMKSLLAGKRIAFIGDSNVRAIYKDWLWLLQNNMVIPERKLKTKLEKSFAGDTLLFGSTDLHRGRDFMEVREYQDESIHVTFMFVTKCISPHVKSLFEEFKSGKKHPPDIIIFNSCLWDVSRWGPDGVDMYKKNMAVLMTIMQNSLPLKTLVLFTTTLPVSLKMEGAFLVPEVDFLKSSIPFDVMEANQFLRALVVPHGFDVVDLHFHLRFQLHRRSHDGVHWDPIVVRHLTNILLTHISISLGVKLPGRARQYAHMRMDCVESAEWIGHSVDSKLSEPVSTLTLEDIEVSGSRFPLLSTSESCVLPAEFDDLLPLDFPDNSSDLSNDLPDGLPDHDHKNSSRDMYGQGSRQISPNMRIMINNPGQLVGSHGIQNSRGVAQKVPLSNHQNVGPNNGAQRRGQGNQAQERGQNDRTRESEQQHHGSHRIQNSRGVEQKVALSNHQNVGPNNGAQRRGQGNQAQERGQNDHTRKSEQQHHRGQNRRVDYRPRNGGDRGKNVCAREREQHYRRPAYQAQVQNQGYRTQNQRPNNIEVSQYNQVVLEQPWENRRLVGGMHASNYVDAPQPSPIQMRFRPYWRDRVRHNSRFSKYN